MPARMPAHNPESTTLRSRVPPRAAGTALVDYLAARFRYRSRAQWAAAVVAGEITLDDAQVDAEHALRGGEVVAYAEERREPAVDTAIEVLHEAESWVVAFKPGGLPCHADGAFLRTTFARLLAQRLERPKVSLVHRLDRETAGLLVVAKTRRASRALHAQFEARTVEKVYRAVVHGTVAEDEFAVDAPIGRAPASEISIRRAVVAADAEGAQAARTKFRVLDRVAHESGPRSILEVRPVTGRAHQIRVHLEHAGHPLVGDKLYGRSDADFLAWLDHVKAGGDPAWSSRLGAPRHLLDAVALAFDDPETGERRRFERS